MKITRDKMFFSKDLIHTLAYVGMFVAAIISVGACKSGIWVAAILAWIVAGIIIGLAIISDYKKAELLKNGTRIIGKVTATKRVHIKFHMSTYHLADEDVIYPYVVHYQYKVKGETYNGKVAVVLVQSMYSERGTNKNSSRPKESGPKYSSQTRKLKMAFNRGKTKSLSL